MNLFNAPHYSLTVSSPNALLIALAALAQNNAAVSLEGEFDLSASGLENISADATEVLRRSTFFAMDAAGHEIQTHFAVIPLSPHNREYLPHILDQLDFKWDVWHVQIAQNNQLVFAAYDCFMQGSVLLDAAFANAEKLVQAKLIDAYEIKNTDIK